MKPFFYALKEILEIVLVAVIAVAGIRTFLVQPFLVNGASMEPNFNSGDYILVNELSYRFREPARGEVAVFKYPKDNKTYFIKRIIGLPGERIVISESGIHIYNESYPDGFELKESYLPLMEKTVGEKDIELGKDEYFVLGDNRDFSYDSRQWGVLPKKNIVGAAWVRLWPVGDIMSFAAPSY